MDLRDYIRDVPDFPEPGILFRDITPILNHPSAFRSAVKALRDAADDLEFDAVAGIEARGFLFAAPVALELGLPFIPMRKAGKLPRDTHTVSYGLEYGKATLEMHSDAIFPGDRVLIVDDVLATGGTLAAGADLVRRAGGTVSAVTVLIELADLAGRKAIHGHKVLSLLKL